MYVIADLQLHSRFARAVSKDMTIPNIALWAKRKGIGLVATGDWTHPLWFREIEQNLEEVGNGLLSLRAEVATNGAEVARPNSGVLQSLADAQAPSVKNPNLSALPAPGYPLFLLATEVSCIYSQNGKVRRVHTLIWVPTLESARKISQEMTKRGCNLMSDGRPIIGLSSIQVAELVFSIEPKALIIPAHAWTPWFSVYGSLGGFDSIDEAFGPFAKQIYAIETGLSSNPSMNWRIKELDNRSVVSFSDAHSMPKLGREATVFELQELNYGNIYSAIKGDVTTSRIAYTVEFYPEEGKYHFTGHRACNIRWSPDETKKKGVMCPVCGKPLTQGVVQRVEELAGRSEEDLNLTKVHVQTDGQTLEMIASKAFPNRPPFVMLVPLQEIIAEAIGSPFASTKVVPVYQKLADECGGEFNVLLSLPISDIAKAAGERIAQGVEKVRTGDIHIDPGYDGVFGVVKIWREGEEKPLLDSSKEQLAMF